MKEGKTKFKKVRVLSFASSCIGVVLVAVFPDAKDLLVDTINNVLTFEPIYAIIVSISFLSGAYHTVYITSRKISFGAANLFKIFGPLIDPIANSLAFGFVIASSLRMIRGLFSQYFLDIKYYKEFDLFDITSIALSSLILLVWSTSSLIRFSLLVFTDPPNERSANVEPVVDLKEDEEDK